MKKFITIIFTAIIMAMVTSFTVKGQDRVNEEQLAFIENSNKITKIIGWKFYEGKWFGNPNVISVTDESRYSKTERKSRMEKCLTNLKSIQLHKFFYRGADYYVVDLCYADGLYLYPSIHEDWISQIGHSYFLLSENDIQNFKSPSETLTCLEVRTASYWEGGDNSQKEIENREIRELTRNDLHYPLTSKIAFKRYKDVVRIGYESKYNYDWENLDDEYFEIKITDWVF